MIVVGSGSFVLARVLYGYCGVGSVGWSHGGAYFYFGYFYTISLGGGFVFFYFFLFLVVVDGASLSLF